MAGITDAPFRRLAWAFGAGYVVSEMVSARSDLWQTEKSRLRRSKVEGITPVAVQIAGGDPETLADAAVRHWHDGADIIDVNLGCPAKKVCRKAAGSQLLADEGLVAEILAATVNAVPIPVTAKIRSGYSLEQRNGVQIARIAEDQGIKAIAVHGRTRACKFAGPVEHDTVRQIKRSVGIPVFANGDISTADDAYAILEATGVDGVMIGRAALGAPWLPGLISGCVSEPGLDEKLDVLMEHVAAIHEFYGPPGARVARKHVQWYLEKLDQLGPRSWRREQIRSFNRLDECALQLEFLSEIGWHSVRDASGLDRNACEGVVIGI